MKILRVGGRGLKLKFLACGEVKGEGKNLAIELGA